MTGKKNKFFSAFIYDKRRIIVFSVVAILFHLTLLQILLPEDFALGIHPMFFGFYKNLSIIQWFVIAVPFLMIPYFLAIFIEKVLKGNFSSYILRFQSRKKWFLEIEKTSIKTSLLMFLLIFLVSFVSIFFDKIDYDLKMNTLLLFYRILETVAIAELFLALSFLFKNINISFWTIVVGYLSIISEKTPWFLPFGLSSAFMQGENLLNTNKILMTISVFVLTFVLSRTLYYISVKRRDL